jgi:D-altritol 5-dehydrogenase
MRAIVFPDKNGVNLTEVPEPRAGPGQVVVQVKASGICHTDFEVLRGNYGKSAFPLIPGHEYAGQIVDVGDGTKGFSVGDRVVVDPNLECGTCPACRRGWAHLCENLGAYGVTENGGFAELSAVNASAAIPIGDMPFHIAALAEPMGCVLNGVNAAQGHMARTAMIFGAGPMGLLMAIALGIRGVAEIYVVDIDDARLELGESFGFIPVASESDELRRMKHAIDLVVEATGVPAVASNLTNYIVNGGTGHFFGVCPSEARIDFSPFEVFRRQLTLVGSHSLNHNIPEAIDVINAYGPDIARLVTHRMSLEDVAGVLIHKAPAGSLKIQSS